MQRADAPRYLTLLAVSFGVTVIVTRVFLALTGYPQIGNDTLHIAHALWGGLALAVAVGLVLQYANVRLLPLVALLGGVGVGLFIDEIGKFITQKNDYFFPLAAPLIYLAVLASVWLAHHARATRPRSARERMYTVLDWLQSELDGSLTEPRRAELLDELRLVGQERSEPRLADLAARLREHLVSAPATPASGSRWAVTLRRAETFEQRHLPRRRMRLLLIATTALLGLAGIGQCSLLVALLADPTGTRDRLRPVVTNESVSGWQSLLVLAVVLAFTVLVGALLLGCAWLLLRHRDERAVTLGRRGLVFSLVVVNVLAAYFDVEKVVFLCVFELLILGALQRYAVRFPPGAGEQPAVVDLSGPRSVPAVAELPSSDGATP